MESKGAFLWDDPDQDQWSEITRIMEMNRWIFVQSGVIGPFDVPWSRITDADPDYPKGTHPKTILDSGFHFMDSSPETAFRILFQWNLDYGFQSLVGFRIPQGAVYSGIQCPGFRIPPVKMPLIPESGFPYMGREIAKLHLRSFLIKRIIFKPWQVYLVLGFYSGASVYFC